MASESSSGDPSPDQSGASSSPKPDWADGLRQLYDSVVDEPLPDTFRDLLDRLEDDGSEENRGKANGSDRSRN